MTLVSSTNVSANRGFILLEVVLFLAIVGCLFLASMFWQSSPDIFLSRMQRNARREASEILASVVGVLVIFVMLTVLPGFANGLIGYTSQVYQVQGIVKDAAETNCSTEGEDCAPDFLGKVYMDGITFSHDGEQPGPSGERLRPTDVIEKKVTAQFRCKNISGRILSAQEVLDTCDKARITAIEG
jgi:hypothetical protein